MDHSASFMMISKLSNLTNRTGFQPNHSRFTLFFEDLEQFVFFVFCRCDKNDFLLLAMNFSCNQCVLFNVVDALKRGGNSLFQ